MYLTHLTPLFLILFNLVVHLYILVEKGLEVGIIIANAPPLINDDYHHYEHHHHNGYAQGY